MSGITARLKPVAPYSSAANSNSLKVPQKIIPRASAIAAIFLVATALAHLFFREETAHLPGFVFVDVDSEGNIPTWYASLLLELTGVVAFVISNSDLPAQKTGWRGVALMLMLMGMDEVASLHNMPSRRLSETVGNAGGYLVNAWVLPASLLVIVLAVIYLPFIWRLPLWLKRGLIGASLAYLVGAVGFEILSSKFEYASGGLNYDGLEHYSLRFELAAAAEEFYEYVGVLAALGVLLKHASNLGARLSLGFGGNQTFSSNHATA